MKWLDDEQLYAEHVARMMDGVDAKMLSYSQRHDMVNRYITDLIVGNKRLIAAVLFLYEGILDDILALVEAQEYSVDDMCYQIRYLIRSAGDMLRSGEFEESDE